MKRIAKAFFGSSGLRAGTLALAAGLILLALQGCGSDGYDSIGKGSDGGEGPGGGGAVLGAPVNGSVACVAAYGEDAAGNTTSSWVQLEISATDDGGVTGYYISENPAGPAATAATCAGGGPTVDTDCWNGVDPAQPSFVMAGIDYALTGGVGDYMVYVWFKDAEGNISEATVGTITYVDAGGGCG